MQIEEIKAKTVELLKENNYKKETDSGDFSNSQCASR